MFEMVHITNYETLLKLQVGQVSSNKQLIQSGLIANIKMLGILQVVKIGAGLGNEASSLWLPCMQYDTCCILP